MGLEFRADRQLLTYSSSLSNHTLQGGRGEGEAPASIPTQCRTRRFPKASAFQRTQMIKLAAGELVKKPIVKVVTLTPEEDRELREVRPCRKRHPGSAPM